MASRIYKGGAFEWTEKDKLLSFSNILLLFLVVRRDSLFKFQCERIAADLSSTLALKIPLWMESTWSDQMSTVVPSSFTHCVILYFQLPAWTKLELIYLE